MRFLLGLVCLLQIQACVRDTKIPNESTALKELEARGQSSILKDSMPVPTEQYLQYYQRLDSIAKSKVNAYWRMAETLPEFTLDYYLTGHLSEEGKKIYKDSSTQEIFYTQTLERAIKAKNEQIIKDDGGYKEGYINGLDYDPLICGQDSGPFYLYHIIQQDKDVVIVDVAGGAEDGYYKRRGIYRLVRSQDKWQIDGVCCGEDEAKLDCFNMSNPKKK